MAKFEIIDGVGVIPEGTKVIDRYAFDGCTELTSIIIPESIIRIAYNAFSGCTGLTSITIPNGVILIDRSAFEGCTGLTSVTIPASVKAIEDLAFYGCTGLTSIVVDEKNAKYDSRDNCNAIIETATNCLIKGCASTIIPEGVTAIGARAFEGCTGLTSITIPEGVTEIRWDTFSGCTGLTNVVISEGVTEIGRRAFRDCTGLTSVSIPASVKAIGERAFLGCTGLTEVTIPASVTAIGEAAFVHCTGLTSIVVDEKNEKYDSRDNCNAIIETATNCLITGCASTIIPESVTAIGYGAFLGCTGLTSVTIPESVTAIGEAAFAHCTGLTEITIPESVTKIGEYAFYECTGLTNVVISEGVQVICRYAFNRCSSLKIVTLPVGVKKLGKNEDDDTDAFSRCDSLTTIYVPAKNADYYKKRLFENLHDKIVELEPLSPAQRVSSKSRDSNKKSRQPATQRVHLAIYIEQKPVLIDLSPLSKEEELQVADEQGASDATRNYLMNNSKTGENFVFAHAYSNAELYVIDPDTSDDIYTDEEFEISPGYGIMNQDEARENYLECADDQESYDEYIAYLNTKFGEDYDRFINKGLKTAWEGLKSNKINEENFVPATMRYVLNESGSKKAFLRGCYLDYATIVYYIDIPEGEDFDPDKLNYINIDTEYKDNSEVLSNLLARDVVCLNAIIYDGKMYFADCMEMDISEQNDEQYDIVDENIASV